MCCSVMLMAQANDLCANATVLACGDALVGESSVGSTDQSADVSCTMGTGIWYSIVGDGNNIVIDITNDAFDVEVAVASGTGCAGFANVSCTDGGTTAESVTFASVNGTTYYIYIGDWSGGGTDAGTFDIAVSCVVPPTPPANDMCADAVAAPVNTDLACGMVVNGTIEAATDSGTDTPPEDNTICGGTEDDDVWFSFVATNTQHQIDLTNVTGSTTDLYHSVWEGSCGALTNIICSDPNSSTVVGLTVGATYYVRVYSWTATTGQDSVFDLCIGTPPPPPPGDECGDAIPYPGDVTAGTCVTDFDFTIFSDNGNPSPTCDFGGDAVAWFSWTAPIITAAGDPLDLNFDDGDGQTNDCDIGVEFYETDCTTTASNCLGNASGLVTGLVQGTDYVILAYDDSTPAAACDFCLSIACSAPTVTTTTTCQIGDDDNFYIDVTFVNMGVGNTTYTLDVAGPQTDITAAGTYSYGPFPSGTPVDVVITGVEDATCGFTVTGLDKDCTCDELAVEAGMDATFCPGDAPVDLAATLGDVIPGMFVDYTVTPSAAGSCTATPDNPADCVDLALGDDTGSGPIPLGFNVDFFGSTYSSVCVGSNGYITFTCVDETDLSEDAFPNATDPNAIVALFWDDLNGNDALSGPVCAYPSTIGGQTCFVVDYQGMAHFGGGETVTGQIIICPDGAITINCIDCQSDGGTDSAGQGIENEDGTIGYFDPAFPGGSVPGAASTSNCVTFTPNTTADSPCTFVGWVTDLNDIAGTTVATTEMTSVSPAVTTTYYSVVDCGGVICTDTLTITVDATLCCTATAADITTTDPTRICVDGVGDPIDVTFNDPGMGNTGIWVITDPAGIILDLPAGPPFDLDGAGAGQCLIWYVNTDDAAFNPMVGDDAAAAVAASSCAFLSNSIIVDRIEVTAATISTTDPLTICVNDGIDEPINVTIDDGGIGANGAWVITDATGVIVGLPAGPPFILDGAGTGVCSIWWVNYDDPAFAPMMGDDAAAIVAAATCAALSNPITVTRNDCDLCNIGTSAISTTDPVRICVDGVGDPINVTIDTDGGGTGTWVITDPAGIILDLPAGPPFDLDGAGPGQCLIWYVNSDDPAFAPMVSDDAAAAVAASTCAFLSNPITVDRIEVMAAAISTADATTICVDDGIDEPINVTIDDAGMGANGAWVITDAAGIIVGLPPGPPFVLDGAGTGVCSIWWVNYDDPAFAPMMGDDAAAIVAAATCAVLSNPIVVTRNTCGVCEAAAPVVSNDGGDCDADPDGSGDNTPFVFAEDGTGNATAPYLTEYIVVDATGGNIIGVYATIADAQTAANAQASAGGIGGTACIQAINHNTTEFDALVTALDLEVANLGLPGGLCGVVGPPCPNYGSLENLFAAIGPLIPAPGATVATVELILQGDLNGLGFPVVVPVPDFCYVLSAEDCITVDACAAAMCQLEIIISNFSCDPGADPVDPADDMVSFDYTVNDLGGTGTTWSDDQGQAGQAYGTTVTVGPIPADASNFSITVTDDADPDCTITGTQTLTDCGTTPNDIPTLSEWGLITLALLLMTFGSVKMAVGNVALAGLGSRSVPMPGGNTFRLPFDAAIFRKSLTFTGILTLIGFAICFAIFGAVFMPDIIGVLIAGPVFAYLAHLLYILETRKEN